MAAGLQDRLLSNRQSVLMVARNRSCLTDLRKPEPLAQRIAPPRDAFTRLSGDDEVKLQGGAGHRQLAVQLQDAGIASITRDYHGGRVGTRA
jgi:hypothetical protein